MHAAIDFLLFEDDWIVGRLLGAVKENNVEIFQILEICPILL